MDCDDVMFASCRSLPITSENAFREPAVIANPSPGVAPAMIGSGLGGGLLGVVRKSASLSCTNAGMFVATVIPSVTGVCGTMLGNFIRSRADSALI